MDATQWLQRRSKTPRRTDTVDLCSDWELIDELAELQSAVPRGNEKLVEWRAQIEAVKADIAEATIHVPVQSMDPDEYLDLKDRHRPTGEARERGDQYDGATYWPALFRESLTPDGPLEPRDAAEIWGMLTAGEQHRIKLQLQGLNEAVPDLGFTRPGIATTAGTGQNPTTSTDTASP
jgi:hypothetical protein